MRSEYGVTYAPERALPSAMTTAETPMLKTFLQAKLHRVRVTVLAPK